MVRICYSPFCQHNANKANSQVDLQDGGMEGCGANIKLVYPLSASLLGAEQRSLYLTSVWIRHWDAANISVNTNTHSHTHTNTHAHTHTSVGHFGSPFVWVEAFCVQLWMMAPVWFVCVFACVSLSIQSLFVLVHKLLRLNRPKTVESDFSVSFLARLLLTFLPQFLNVPHGASWLSPSLCPSARLHTTLRMF